MLSILATVDGSNESMAVVQALEKLAKGRDAQVQLLTIVERPAPTRRESTIVRSPTDPISGVPGAPESALGTRPTPQTRYAETDDQAVERMEAEGQELMASVAQRLRDDGIEVKTDVVMAEDPAKAIVDYARENSFDLIAMATHGRSGLSALVQGSVAAAVVKSGIAPVVLVRPGKN